MIKIKENVKHVQFLLGWHVKDILHTMRHDRVQDIKDQLEGESRMEEMNLKEQDPPLHPFEQGT
eukprot:10490763-Prorocentrum_lima.AAC.1